MVTLRPLLITDLPFLLEVRNHESTRVNLENDSTFTLNECEKWFGSLKFPWYIIEINNHKVGYFRTNEFEIGCDIHPDYRRKGYAKIAYEIYLKDKKYASLWVFDNNFAKQLYLNLGFKPTGNTKFIRERLYIQMEYFNKL
jgi:RimJ/RimL family protein N-acetyltransferase